MSRTGQRKPRVETGPRGRDDHARPERSDGGDFECPFDHRDDDCDCGFSSVGSWAEHMRSEHGIEGPL